MAEPGRNGSLTPTKAAPAAVGDAAGGASTDGAVPSSRKEVWTNKLGFFLSVMGYNIGLGDILRFPYLVMKNGGGAFLIPYFTFLFSIGVPLFVMELSLGQYTGKTPLVFYQNLCPILKGIGWCNIISCFFFNVYYMIQLAWICFYLINSFMNPLPWSECDPAAANASLCYKPHLSDNYTVSPEYLTNIENCSIYDSKGKSPTEYFFDHNLLSLTEGIHDLGGMRWDLLGLLLFSWILVYCCLIKGVKSLGKVVYVTALGPYVFLLILFIRGLFLPGGRAGIMYYLTPDWSSLATAQPWVEAAQQIFWSLAPAWGGTICMASHNAFNNNIYRDSLTLPVLSAMTSFFGGFVTFAYIGDLAMRKGQAINCVLKPGPGLAFLVYPSAFDTLPWSQLWSVIFFVLLLFLGLDSSFTTFEAMYQSLIDEYPILRRWQNWAVKLGFCAVSMSFGIPMVTRGGYYIYTLVDWYQVTFMMGVALFEVLAIIYAYGSGRVRANIRLMTGVRMTIFWDIVWRAVLPIVLLALFIFTMMEYRPPSFAGYKYSDLAIAMGWVFASLGIVPLPMYSIYLLAYELFKRSRSEDKEPLPAV
uniref:Transporter n=1 Tax=Macrostomum lignano TaxID=282301 RepID=A0A1I8J525_9PLAT